ncbi:DNA polymerase III subunit delta [Danxiaibacter flavus]|uniref:DNA polymerase III subunit delta n=1 Tax=Danxiaibacter flavus TaxID=3049108 RepID=A0ABV3ZFR8_9BACT|nr:DNA polymerase III subunit delta [Chitinophagaceae bacterium DXS]
MSAEKILADWKKQSFKPVYWLEGEESYFIDRVVDYAEHHILSESEAGFNLTVFYGRDADWASVVNACRRYPMFAERQVVLLKEAQQMRDIEKLEPYIENPQPSTVFVVSYKEKKLDARTKFAKQVQKHGEMLTTKKLYDNQLPDWTNQMVQQHGLSINQKALALLVDHIGNDLSRLQNEVEKLAVNLGARKDINEDDIEEYIGFSKEFNVFELQDAVAKKDMAKAIRIIQYFKANPKAAPIQLILPTIYGFFSKVYAAFGMDNKSEQALIPVFNRNPFAARTGMQAMQTYGYSGVERILLLLHQYNLRSIGIGDAGTEDADLMKELIVKIMT